MSPKSKKVGLSEVIFVEIHDLILYFNFVEVLVSYTREKSSNYSSVLPVI